jgi:hypothetical protein
MGHYKRIQVFEEVYHNNSNIEERMYYVDVKDKKEAAIKQSIQYQIPSEFTDIVSTEKELVGGQFEVQEQGPLRIVLEGLPAEEYKE